MDRNEERALSLRLSFVLEDIGVSHKMVMHRRNTFLKYEKLTTFIKSEQLGLPIKCRTFGSQTEGTTTMGLELPPQHCHLQLYLREKPAPVKYDNNHVKSQLNDIVFDENRNVFLQNNYIDNVSFNNMRVAGYQIDKRGPAIGVNNKFDFVLAVKCKEFPKECLFWKVKPRPGHWPTRSVLESCSSDGVSIVPVGYPGSEHAIIEWRFCTSMVERKIMFSCNMAQIKTYVLLKYLKKEFFILSSKCIENRSGKGIENGSGKGNKRGSGKGKENESGKGKKMGAEKAKKLGAEKAMKKRAALVATIVKQLCFSP
ncbi:uncharacterized protein LOC128217561 isoform X2 [Mya arenaria]|uniref:uncharacterized protein LOC128217561 isoform X2 n=1 Tax=Mya arenaria TaxID=6604 RepID=UPI0022E09399|nr:uncharacterized protein LOC128217561 isoform X2 [Mya arenaria]